MSKNILNESERVQEAINWASDCIGLTGGDKVSEERARAYVKANYPGGWEAFVAECCTYVTLDKATDVRPAVSLTKRYRTTATPDGRWGVEQAPGVFVFVSDHRNGIGTTQCQRWRSRKLNGFSLN